MTGTRTRPARWTAADIGDQRGRTVVVTGANTGIGLETAMALAEHGAEVMLACRDTRKAETAAARITEAAPGAVVEIAGLDLASLASVREAAALIRSRHQRLDVLINNAALTATPSSRIVTVSSVAHRQGRIDVNDLHFRQRPYRRTAACGQSKLANLMFAYELQRRLDAAGAPTISVAVHPGTVRTDLQRHAAGATRVTGNALMRLLGQRDARMAALPALRAATDPGVRGGEYYGPDGFLGLTGHPVRVDSSVRSHDVATQQLLWAQSERLTGISYPL
jgi:NAD(P)-dependent dehydrogenase (short-subunit alcohol dehydrogenase family)